MTVVAKPLRTVLLLALVIAVGQLATTLYLPSLPDMSADLGVQAAVASLTLTVYWAGFACANLIAGPLSDVRGRRPILVGGLVIYVCGAVVCVLAPNIWILIAGRVLQSLGASAAPVVGRAVVRDLFDGPKLTRAMTWIGAAMAVAPALGPVFGGIIQQTFGWRASLLVLALLGLVLLPLLWRSLAETLPPAKRRTGLDPAALVRDYQRLLGDGEYRRYVTAVSFLFGTIGVFFAVSPFLFISLLDMSPVAFGLLNLLNVAGYLVGSIGAGRISRRLNARAILAAGTLVAVAGGLVMTALSLAGFITVWAVMVPMVIFGIGFGMVVPSGTSGALSRHPDRVGLASALLGFLQVGACSLGTVIGGNLHGETTHALAFVILALTSVAAVAGLRLRPLSPAPDAPPSDSGLMPAVEKRAP